MPQICEMVRDRLLLMIFFFALKNPTASAGFQPANLGTKGQHATSRPPKPLCSRLSKEVPQIIPFPIFLVFLSNHLVIPVTDVNFDSFEMFYTLV